MNIQNRAINDEELRSQLMGEYPTPCVYHNDPFNVGVQNDSFGWMVCCETCIALHNIISVIGVGRSQAAAVADWNMKQEREK